MVAIPRIVKVRQKFSEDKIANIEEAVHAELKNINLNIKPGANIAIATGSRGICNIAKVVAQLVKEVKALGGNPFIIPAMGSHGGATAEGQQQILADYGITEETMGAPVRATMKVVKLGNNESGVPVYLDKYAYESDGIIAVNRIKAHTDFHGPIESGVIKMLVIGLGKRAGAEAVHTYGIYGLRNYIPSSAKVVLEKAPIMAGIGLIENAYDQTAKIVALRPEEMEAREQELLLESKGLMPSLPFDRFDVLVMNEIGKNISGTGMDTNITGRIQIRGEKDPDKPFIYQLVALDLTEESHGNALGVGMADVVSKKLTDKIDIQKTYTNVITSGFLTRGAIPITMPTDREAIEVALK
ncbi:MAG: lactate racemase domain-containing protein, partial [Bacillota bacterium]|nr:lactate racemase domain-containing protein [Bacillota bacterium]